MRIIVADHPVAGSTVVTLQGELDIDCGLPLRATLAALLDRSISRIVIDLGPVSFCDSTSLSAFADTERRCRQAGGYLRLAAPSPFLHRILTVVGLAARIPVYTTVQAACV